MWKGVLRYWNKCTTIFLLLDSNSIIYYSACFTYGVDLPWYVCFILCYRFPSCYWGSQDQAGGVGGFCYYYIIVLFPVLIIRAPQYNANVILTLYYNNIKFIRQQMSYFSPTVENILANRKQRDNSKQIIKQLNKDLPVLSNIVDYGGQSTVDDILYLDDSEKNQKNYNNFEKILYQAGQGSSERSSKKYLSFIDYKAQPAKIRQAQRPKSKKTLKTSIVVEMPEKLKQMKNQILMLPSIGQSRITSNKESSHVGSRLLESLKRSQSKRYQTQASESSNTSQTQKRNCLLSLRSILRQFESPELNCNNYILFRHKQCKKILQQEQHLSKQYKKFESFGSPPKRIIQLKKLLHSFQSTMEKNMDSEIAHQINNMDSKRYDIVLKHEEEARRLNVQKFRERKKQQRLEELKGDLSSGESRTNNLGFKLNSKGNLIYLNKGRAHK